MTYQYILNMVRDTAEAVNPTGHFSHGRNSDAANNPELPYPHIHLYPFNRTSEPNDHYKKTAPLLMYFVEADTGEQDAEEREGIISRMDTLCTAFIDRLITDFENDVEFTNIQDEPQYQILEGVSGYSLSLTVRGIVSC